MTGSRVRLVLAPLAIAGLIAAAVMLSSDGRPAVMKADYLSLVPLESFADIGHYADFVAVVTIESEHVIPPTERQQSRLNEGGSTGLLNTYVATVDEVLWTVTEGAPGPQVEFEGSGRWVNDAGNTPLAPYFEVGREYVVAFLTTQDGALAPMVPNAAAPVEGERLREWQYKDWSEVSPLAVLLSGREPTLEALRVQLAAVPVDRELRARFPNLTERMYFLTSDGGEDLRGLPDPARDAEQPPKVFSPDEPLEAD